MKRHFTSISKKAGRQIRHWWLLLIASVLCVVTGILVFVFPVESYMTLSVLFGILMLLVGAAQLVVASTSSNYLMMRGYVIVGGILDLLLGLFLCLYPGVTLVLLPILLGVWMMYHSFMIISFAGDLDTFDLGGKGTVIVSGVILLVLSLLVLMNPFGAGVATVIIMAGVGLILLGVILGAMSFMLKDVHLALTDTQD